MSTDPTKSSRNKNDGSGNSSVCPGIEAGCPGGKNCPAKKRIPPGTDSSKTDDKTLAVYSPNMQVTTYKGAQCPQRNCPIPIIINAQADQCNANTDLRIELYIHQLSLSHCTNDQCEEEAANVNTKSSSKAKSKGDSVQEPTGSIVSKSIKSEDKKSEKPTEDEDEQRSRRSVQSDVSRRRKSDTSQGQIDHSRQSDSKSADRERSQEFKVKSNRSSRASSKTDVDVRIDKAVNTDHRIDDTEIIGEGRFINRSSQT
ncbi:hypothetical protein WA026_011007 [Henosepilachna vigintioctopunctata]|uniref:Uncharacterized protein n=1 Tax=Henosepilachna vigintioctopunctata TaxID=420089 RepID=A0AAW1UQR5_9CUCU